MSDGRITSMVATSWAAYWFTRSRVPYTPGRRGDSKERGRRGDSKGGGGDSKEGVFEG